MNNNRATPTLSGVQTGAFDQVKATSLAIYGDGLVTGTLTASAFGGACITSALNSTSVMTAASVAALSNVYASTANALTSAGGTITGSLTVVGQLNASNMSVLGDFVTIRSYETHSSNLVIDNGGTGPALRVTQAEVGPLGAQPVAEFYNGTGMVALIIDNAGNVAVNKPTAGFELDVSGVVCATGLSGCITDSHVTTNSTWAASATAVKDAYALASAAVPSSGGYVSGTLAVGQTSVYSGITCDVSGIVRASAFQLVSGAAIGGGGSYWDISGTGIWAHAGSNVGVGRAPTGSYALDVSGNANISGNTKCVGLVGIGKDVSGYSLDVSGSVNVTGTITTGNACTFKYWKISGTTPTLATGWSRYSMPTGCTGANTIYVFGSLINSGDLMPLNNFYATGDSWAARLGVKKATDEIEIVLPPGATSAASCAFTAIVVTTA